jgi:hypothetical protein
MPKNKLKEKIRDILNEEMDNYEEAQGTGNKDDVFDRTCDQILALFEEELKDKLRITENTMVMLRHELDKIKKIPPEAVNELTEVN